MWGLGGVGFVWVFCLVGFLLQQFLQQTGIIHLNQALENMWKMYLKVLQECLFYAAKISILPKLVKMLLPGKGTLLLIQLCPRSEKECILQRHFFVLHSSNIIVVANVNLNKQEVFNYKVATE